jgi:hypothetical protein
MAFANSELLAERVTPDETRAVHLVARADGQRFLRFAGVRESVRLKPGLTRDELRKLAQFLVDRPEPIKDTLVQLLTKLGSTHVQ